MTSSVDAHLEITPESEIAFSLSEKESMCRVSMVLKHPDPDSAPVAFKVKTTQPRRYLVRPNQGVIQPGCEETVEISLVEKDKNILLKNYTSLGEAALAHCKDKFLVQSIAVTNPADVSDTEKLTAFWASLPSRTLAIANKKLHVCHSVGTHSTAVAPTATPKTNVSDMSKDQLAVEVTKLRQKYDELVAFSVNLTAERDILNNTLEQTKRDLNLAQNSSSATKGTMSGMPPKKEGMGASTVIMLVTMLVVGAKLQQIGLLQQIPVLGSSFGNDEL